MVWTYLPHLRSGQNHFARHSERGKTRQTKRDWKTKSGKGQAQRAVENTEKWRKLVVESSVVPLRPPGLRDK